MTYQQGLAIAKQYGLVSEYRRAYRYFKPWWRFWVRESDAVASALEDWDMGVRL